MEPESIIPKLYACSNTPFIWCLQGKENHKGTYTGRMKPKIVVKKSISVFCEILSWTTFPTTQCALNMSTSLYGEQSQWRQPLGLFYAPDRSKNWCLKNKSKVGSVWNTFIYKSVTQICNNSHHVDVEPPPKIVALGIQRLLTCPNGRQKFKSCRQTVNKSALFKLEWSPTIGAYHVAQHMR